MRGSWRRMPQRVAASRRGKGVGAVAQHHPKTCDAEPVPSGSMALVRPPAEVQKSQETTKSQRFWRPVWTASIPIMNMLA